MREPAMLYTRLVGFWAVTSCWVRLLWATLNGRVWNILLLEIEETDGRRARYTYRRTELGFEFSRHFTKDK